MERQTDYIDDIINRYIYQVMRNLPAKNSKDIEEELRTLISDMLEDKTNGNPTTKEDIHNVLKELGSPYELSEKYSDKAHYLIGPAIYPTYIMIMKIVLFVSLLSLCVTTVINMIITVDINHYQYIGDRFGDILGNCIGDILNGLLAAFGWVTIIFTIFERKGITFNKKASGWDPASLPSTPVREIAIPIWKPLTSIVFTIVFAIILIFAPQLLGAYYLSDYSRVVPIFNLNVLRTVMPLLIVCLSINFIKYIWEIIERKITMKYAIMTLVIDLITIFIIALILTKFQIWNNSFLIEKNSLFQLNSNLSMNALRDKLNSIVLAIFSTIYLLNCFSSFYKAFKYRNRL